MQTISDKRRHNTKFLYILNNNGSLLQNGHWLTTSPFKSIPISGVTVSFIKRINNFLLEVTFVVEQTLYLDEIELDNTKFLLKGYDLNKMDRAVLTVTSIKLTFDEKYRQYITAKSVSNKTVR